MLLRLLIATILFALPSRGAGQPPVILITVDGLGWGDLSVPGKSPVPTPRIDGLLSQSTVFRDFHVSPLHAPSRAALLTGLHPHRAGVWGNHSGRHRLRPGLLTMAGHLKASGWATGLHGTWALGDSCPCRPQDNGFMEVLTHPGGTQGGAADFYSNDGTDDLWLVNGEITHRTGSSLESCFGGAITFVEKHAAQPFFCQVSPSLPAGMSESALQPFRNRPDVPNPLRAAWISELDESIGDLLDHLDRLNLATNTIVILTSTTGSPGPHRGREKQAANPVRRGGQGSPYEGGHCVPLLIRWPGGNLKMGDVNAPAAHIDLLPTVAELTATPLSAEFRPDGISLVPFLRGEVPVTPLPERILITDAQEIPVPIQWRQNCVMAGPWRLINGRELYDLRNDPGQRKNIAADDAGTVERLRAAGESWWQDLKPATLEPVRTIVGGPQDPVLLTPHDWLARGSAPLTRNDVIRGTPANAAWLLDVTNEGSYDILLRRWPLSVDRALSDSFFIPDKARIRIGTHDESKSVPSTAIGVNFRVPLKPGPVALQTWLTGEGKTSGAYFVEIRRAVEVRSAKPVPQGP